MASLNRVFLMGNLTRDPELRYAGGGAGGSAICKFGLAVNRQWRDGSGQQQEETTFVDITVFGRQAETCNEYLRKGRPVFLEGRLQYSQWEDRETGQKRSKIEVVGERVQFLGAPGGREGGDSGGAPRARSERAPIPAGHVARPETQAAPAGPRGGAADGVDFDDIPF